MTDNPLRGHWLLTSLAFAVALAFATFVWPTSFRYDHIQMGGGSSYPVRINRFTQKVDILMAGGWERMGNP